MRKTCIIIPCYNEQNRLPANDFETFISAHDTIDFCFVNDGSSDATLSVLEDLRQNCNKRVHILDLKNNLGKANAVRAGVQAMYKHESYTYLGYFDADLATPLEEIQYLITQLESSESILISFGSRMNRVGSDIKRNLFRHYIGRIFSTASSLLLKLKIYDSQCGAKVFKRETASIAFKNPFISRWLFDLEIFCRIMKAYPDKTIHELMIEVPLHSWIEKGESKIKPTYAFKIPFELIRIKMKYL